MAELEFEIDLLNSYALLHQKVGLFSEGETKTLIRKSHGTITSKMLPPSQ
jgi:hypothetical protein